MTARVCLSPATPAGAVHRDVDGSLPQSFGEAVSDAFTGIADASPGYVLHKTLPHRVSHDRPSILWRRADAKATSNDRVGQVCCNMDIFRVRLDPVLHRGTLKMCREPAATGTRH